MKYLSVCSGIEAATVAWHPLGWQAIGYSEIEKFPSEVLKHHYPDVPNFGDMTKFKEWQDADVDVFVGGTPCQSFSVAGLRKGLDDPRGNLMLTYLAIAKRYQPRWLVWENVPGVLSSNGGQDFGSFLGGLAECGYGFAYRVLDAQYFGVAQRRRRVFVVGYLGDWHPAAAVLFERDSLQGNPAPRREKRQEVAGTIAARFGISRNNHEECVVQESFFDENGIQHTVGTLCADSHPGSYSGQDAYTGRLVPTPVYENHPADSRITEMGEVCSTVTSRWGTGGGNIPLTIGTDLYNATMTGELAVPLTNRADGTGTGPTVMVPQPVAYGFEPGIAKREGNLSRFSEEVSSTLRAEMGDNQAAVIGGQSMAVRRLTPIECERLQGFPDNYTNIKDKCPDGSRYKALGNSMAVPVMGWIGKRIQQVEEILNDSL